ncbi:M1 family metallopeptidase [Marinicrinis lubricantis]|uniref:M1 family metallopeptidase n=1 Tax=Marinicrinis lubricantis TaxID=2086470 RepID=A0ABW1IVE7_9BACL
MKESSLKLRKKFVFPAVVILLTAAVLSYVVPEAKPEQAAYQNAPITQQPGQGMGLNNVPPAPDTVITPEKPKPVALSQRIVEYHLNVELNEQDKSLIGTETLTWKHPGSEPVREVYLHLYANAFESKNTTFYKESGGQLRADKMQEDSFGGIQITSIQTTDGDELKHRVQYVQPDDENPDDHTLLKVRLPDDVQPNEKLTLQIGFEVELPRVYARMGYADDFIMAGQWFPKIAVYEPKGTRGRTDEGWNLHQYHGNSEFYSDFGIYNVKINVPSNYIVAATGFPASKTKVAENRKIYHFYADDVHDFAWAASPNFLYEEMSFSSSAVPGMKIKLYLDPSHKELKDRYFYAAKKAISSYSKWYGTYPYSTLSIVVPPAGANGAGGMEYPTLITGWAADEANPGYELERVIVHEIGHQYWYGMVASNEFEEAWLDEGFTSYAEDKVMEKEFDISPVTPVESIYMTNPAPLKLDSWHYDNHQHYADNVYTRAKLILLAIEDEIGENKMQQVLRSYFQRWKFKHPDSTSFQTVLEQVTKKEWDQFFEQFVFDGQMVDYRIEQIDTKVVQQNGQKAYESSVTITRNGGSYIPVSILFRFDDGTEVTKLWEGKEKQFVFRFTHSAPLSWAGLDRSYEQTLENLRINNFMKAEVPKEEETKWNIGTAQALEFIFGLLGW